METLTETEVFIKLVKEHDRLALLGIDLGDTVAIAPEIQKVEDQIVAQFPQTRMAQTIVANKEHQNLYRD